MKTLRFLFAFVLALGLSPHAKAFQMVVLDPTYSIDVITDLSTFSISFSPCVEPGQLPVGTPFAGCFSFQNETGLIITKLDIDVKAVIPGQSAGCALSSTGLDIFSNPSCSDVTGGYLLSFSGGAITEGEIVTIAESGVDPGAFPATSVTPTGVPEPSSMYLLSTGLGAVGTFYTGRRRRLIRASRT